MSLTLNVFYFMSRYFFLINVLRLLPTAKIWIQQHWQLRRASWRSDNPEHSEGEQSLFSKQWKYLFEILIDLNIHHALLSVSMSVFLLLF